jgi:gustatory receptor
LERKALIFDHLCQASSQLNGILSVPVLFLLTTKFLSIVTSAYASIFSLIHANEVLDDFSLVFPFLFFTDWIRILVLLSAADMPVQQVIENILTQIYNAELSSCHQVRLLRERLTSVTHSKFAQSLIDKVEVRFLPTYSAYSTIE